MPYLHWELQEEHDKLRKIMKKGKEIRLKERERIIREGEGKREQPSDNVLNETEKLY